MHDFEIVASHLAPKAEGVTLLIHDFNPISGCEGSPPFGKPEAITSVNGIRNALDGVRKVLANWEKHQPTAYTKEDDEKRSLPPAYEEDMLRGGSTNSQVRFATQAPVMNSAKIGRADKQVSVYQPKYLYLFLMHSDPYSDTTTTPETSQESGGHQSIKKCQRDQAIAKRCTFRSHLYKTKAVCSRDYLQVS